MTNPRATRLHRKGTTLAMIVSLLFASAILRLEFGFDMAFAVTPDPETETEADMTCGPQDTPVALLEALQTREQRVSDRELQFEDRMQALRVAEAEIDEKLIALADAEASLSALLAIADTAAEDDLARLTSVYENMKPQDAAALFEEMDSAFAAGFIGRMQPEAAALIMTNLEPETAHLFSVMLASRNSSAPQQ